MRKSILLLMTVLVLSGMWTCSCNNKVEPKPDSTKPEPTEPQIEVPAFSQGADISWVTEMEAYGHKFRDSEGNETDCFELMQELGLDAIRLRVWVDPSEHGNWCNTNDLVAKAKRATKLGMNVMIDFHYSDWWADPNQQHKPAAWKGLSFDNLKKALVEHTTQVMEALKKADIYPAWVQIGNEIRPGMLWDEDASLSAASYDIRECDVEDSGSTSTKIKYRKNFDNLAILLNAGYDAAKAVFQQTKVIVHLDNGHDTALFNWFFDEFKARNGKWDLIGLSIYPYWNRDAFTPTEILTKSIANLNALCVKYNCDAIIVETGVECANDIGQLASETVLGNGREWLSELINAAKNKTQGKCKGVFYWEPECRPGQYRLGAFTEDGRPTVIMDAFKQ